ncbi:arsenite methyltransferase isoform X4 [Corvus hawaiiensis]|uniref:arsenite methyltransferase isoform X4 n=1 Tax=Corvus hawaiiensis TaxID=134902 RepID=UPI002018805A|nr:arsenite methyltransferase isoform X4 [Corvus hawaiiensis]
MMAACPPREQGQQPSLCLCACGAGCQGPGQAGAGVRAESRPGQHRMPGQHRVSGRSEAQAGQSPPEVLQLEADYYGKELQKSEDLKTNACTTSARPLPKAVRDALERVHEEVVARYYGCGLVIPECLSSCWILDLGSGSGRDCYPLSQLVGEQGHVTGIDMTEGQVEVAKKHIAYHMDKFGYRKPNVEFVHGYMEKLGDAGLADERYDIVISNCVINLAPDKTAVLREAFRVLKPGGEMYFSDIYASQRLSETVRRHRVLWGDCRFVSATFRLFKVPGGTQAGPGQVIYKGRIMGHERELVFDANFTFKEGEVVDVDAEMAAILQSSRFAEEFLIRAGGANAAALQGCCRKGVKEKIRDPFQLLERLTAPGPACCPGGTCGPPGCC